jgi:hypothetical protein
VTGPSFLRHWSTERGDPYVVSLVRALVGGLLVYQASRRVVELATGGFFGAVFHIPLWPEALVPSLPLYAVLLVVQIGLGALIGLGLWPREALLASSVVGLYLLGCDRVQYHNNRYALLVFAFLLAFSPCDARVTVRRREASSRAEPLWAQRLAQLQVCIIYLASGGSKLLDADWRGGMVLGDRLLRYGPAAVSVGVPAGLVAWLGQPAIAEVLSKAAIATELGLVLALWHPRLRALALWWGVMFHLSIEVSSKVDIFTWLTLSMYALFAVPTTRERVVEFGPKGRRWAKLVTLLDWLHRFEHRSRPSLGEASPSVCLIDRDGRVATGIDAWVLAARTLPLLFPFWVPLSCVARLRARISPSVVARATGPGP